MAVELDSRAFKALSSPTRVQLLKKLRNKPRSLTSLAEETGLSVQATDEHLHKLANAGLVEKDKKNKWAYYRLTPAGFSLVQPNRQPVYLMLAVSVLLLLAAALTWNPIVPTFNSQNSPLPTIAPEAASHGQTDSRNPDVPYAMNAAMPLTQAAGSSANASQSKTTNPVTEEQSPTPYPAAVSIQPVGLSWPLLFAAAGMVSLGLAVFWWRRA